MKIAPVTDADISACLDLYNFYIENTLFTLEEVPLTLTQYTERVRSVTARYPFLVAGDEDGTVLGFAYLSPFNERSGYRKTADLSVYVRHGYAGRHIGTALLSAVENAAVASGICQLVSVITATNDVSCRFHEANGFVKEGELHHVAEKFGWDCGICYYRKALGGAV